MPQDMTVNDKFTRKRLKTGSIGNRPRFIPLIGHADRILPASPRIIFSKLDTVDMCDKEWIDVDVKCVNAAGIIVYRPFFICTQRDPMLDLTGEFLAINRKIGRKGQRPPDGPLPALRRR